MINRVILLGRVGKDPEIRNTQGGDPIASFSLATSDTWRDKSTGEKKEATEWHNVVCFDPQLSKVIEAYVRKGELVHVEGQIKTRKWEKDGQTRYATEIVLQRFDGKLKLVGGGKRNENTEDERGLAVHKSSANSQSSSKYDSLDDDIPF